MDEDSRRNQSKLNSRRTQQTEEVQKDESSARKRVIPQYKAVTLPEGLSGTKSDVPASLEDRKSSKLEFSREEKTETTDKADDSDDEDRQRRKRENKELSVWKRFSVPSLGEFGLSNSNPDGLKRRSLAEKFSHREVMAMLANFKKEQEEQLLKEGAVATSQQPQAQPQQPQAQPQQPQAQPQQPQAQPQPQPQQPEPQPQQPEPQPQQPQPQPQPQPEDGTIQQPEDNTTTPSPKDVAKVSVSVGSASSVEAPKDIKPTAITKSPS